MKVLEFRNLAREEGQIFYLRKYTCDAVMELPTSSLNAKINFSIETTPLGEKNIIIGFDEPLNYPVLPVKKALKDFILMQDKEGHLPC
ncbi:MAG: hypothetical protein MJ181_11245 [Treponema sp.]|nr:hypothetical protein [Treponema sp.]